VLVITEAEWLARTEPGPMLDFLRDKVSDRKLRLFACGCGRRVSHLMIDERNRRAVEAAEQFADGLTELDNLRSASNAARDALMELPNRNIAAQVDAAYAAMYASEHTEFVISTDSTHSSVARAAISAAAAVSPYTYTPGLYPRVSEVARCAVAELAAQADLIRCVFGNPFRSVTTDPSWLTSNVVDLARTIYDERAFDRLPILADALMDASCADEYILSHCRSEGPHVRGCWVVDLVLGKT
jgi:hypothetical protein